MGILPKALPASPRLRVRQQGLATEAHSAGSCFSAVRRGSGRLDFQLSMDPVAKRLPLAFGQAEMLFYIELQSLASTSEATQERVGRGYIMQASQFLDNGIRFRLLTL
jgi:hypothetical protein